MTAANEALLKDFKKSNKDRKAKLLKRFGFSTQEAYFKHLGVKDKAPAKTGKTKTAPVSSGGKTVKKPVKVAKTKSAPVASSERTDYVIAFDTTGSMNSYISNVKSHVVDLIEKLFKGSEDLRIKIVAFGDYWDMTSPTVFGKAYQESKLTDNQNELVKFVRNAQSTNGGDGDEFYELVIKKINEETPWRDGKRAVLLIGDCECHPVGYTHRKGNVDIVKNAQIDWKLEAKSAKDLGIQYDTLQIHPNVKWYKQLSQITGGVNLNFGNSAKTSQVVEAAVFSRSSTKSFHANYATTMSSGDAELIGAYKSMSSVVDMSEFEGKTKSSK